MSHAGESTGAHQLGGRPGRTESELNMTTTVGLGKTYSVSFSWLHIMPLLCHRITAADSQERRPIVAMMTFSHVPHNVPLTAVGLYLYGGWFDQK
jgi:hypothetical protein